MRLDAAFFEQVLPGKEISAQWAIAVYYKMTVELSAYNVWHVCFLKQMWHVARRDSNPCFFFVKEMFLNGKSVLWQSAEVKHAVDYATEAPDNSGLGDQAYGRLSTTHGHITAILIPWCCMCGPVLLGPNDLHCTPDNIYLLFKVIV